MGWTATSDVEEFWHATRHYLRTHRVPSTVVLSIVDTLRTSGPGGYSGPPELAWCDEGEGVSAVIVRTPPHRPVVSAMTTAAAARWAADRPAPDRLLGPPEAVAALASAWGVSTEVLVPERLHRLDVLRAPADPSPTRLAGDADRDLLWAWLEEFHHEATPDDPLPPRGPVDAAVDESRVVVAVTGGEPVAYASASPIMLGTARIGPVYTRPAHRRRGHGAAVTAALAALLADRGAEEIVLFTDLGNPTSNALYARLGFVGVVDVVDVALVPVARKNV